jgi:hypothetical protein
MKIKLSGKWKYGYSRYYFCKYILFLFIDDKNILHRIISIDDCLFLSQLLKLY